MNSHLLDPNQRGKNERPSHLRLGQPPPPLPPSLCVTGAMSRMGRYQVRTRIIDNNNNDNEKQSQHDNSENSGVPIILSYCIFRPRQLHNKNKPPLLCLHGGPSIPSNYLLPIVNVVTDRSVIFYDQWGCGKSSRPSPFIRRKDCDSNDKNKYITDYPPFSIPTMVEHLRQLIAEHWKLKKFHLLGHSFGGILAYEYLLLMTRKKQHKENHACCSLILSSTPTSSKLIQSESERLLINLNNNNMMSTTGTQQSSNDGTDDEPDDNEGKISSSSQCRIYKSKSTVKYSEEFRQTHECRLPNLPLILVDAISQVGPVSWRGIEAIAGYEAKDTIAIVGQNDAPPTLLMRGEYDFCTELCMKGWKEKLSTGSSGSNDDESNNNDNDNNSHNNTNKNNMLIQTKILSNCSHYGMIEDENLYGKEILRFIQMHDA